MKNKDRKKLQLDYANKNINLFFELLETRFRPNFDKKYVSEIIDLSKSFNIRLTKEQKLKFCKNCHCFWNTKSRKIRLNSKNRTKEYICTECEYIRRFVY